MNKFAVVIPYFGCFKPSISLFLESCNRNNEIDWFIFTDCTEPQNVKLNDNIHWKRTTLENVRKLGEKKLKTKIRLNKAYKLCDLKPFYGLIFEDYLTNYEYWGYGDVDVINGRIFYHLNQIDYGKYDKINWMGHLCFVKNNDFCKKIFLKNTNDTINYLKVLNSENNLGFDERDYNILFLKNNLKIYTGYFAADIDVFYWRMRCVDKKTYHYLLNTKNIKYAPRNYSKQIFVLLDGIVYRIYLKHKKIYKEEFAYIHFRKEVPINFCDYKKDTYLITREGFIDVENKDVFNDYDSMLSLIKKYNNQENYLQELHCFVHYYLRKLNN